jgi:hypothetical protein
MSLVKCLGFATLPCGCVIGRYREVASHREIVYVEEKGPACAVQGHRRNHTVMPSLQDRRQAVLGVAHAS